ncbi:perC transcriptional activator family protein [Escherichia coli 3431]|nr:perC transcriptional activator family protein [Escherichia coli 3431]
MAECLEKKGLYRRAAERWAKVMVQLSDDQKRKVAAQKRAECLRKARRTPVSPVNLTEINKRSTDYILSWEWDLKSGGYSDDIKGQENRIRPETRGQKNAKKYLRELLPVTIRKSDFSGRFLCHI